MRSLYKIEATDVSEEETHQVTIDTEAGLFSGRSLSSELYFWAVELKLPFRKAELGA